MDILVITQYYYPEQFRINDICEELAKNNNVTVITGLPNYPEGQIAKEYRFFKNRKQEINGVKVVRVSMIGRGHNVIKLFLNYLSYMITASCKVMFMKKRYDIVYVHEVSPVTQILPGILAKKLSKCRLVVNCQDIWPEVIKVYGIRESSIIFKIVKKFSSCLYRGADQILISTSAFKNYLIEVCKVKKENINLLYNHAEDIYLHFGNKTNNDNKIHLLFAGNIGKAQNLDCLVNAVSILEPEYKNEIIIDLVGDGSYLEELKQMINSLNLNQIFIFHGRKNINELREYYELADAFILTLEGNSLIGNTIPSKLQSYMGAGKYILASINGETANLINKVDCGKVCSAGDYNQFTINIKDFILNKDIFMEKGIKGRLYFKNNFTIDIFTNKLINYFDMER